jgi:hypothetical protein
MFIDGLVTYLSQLFSQFLAALFWIPQNLLYILLNILTAIWLALSGAVSSFYTLFTSVYQFITGLFVLTLPLLLASMLGLALLVVIVMRIYSFVKDFGVGGFKV